MGAKDSKFIIALTVGRLREQRQVGSCDFGPIVEPAYIGNLQRRLRRDQYENRSLSAFPTRIDGELKYVPLICRLIGDTVYLVYLLMLWLCVRVFRRLRAEARQQKMMYEAKAEGVLHRTL
jgi:hypothetical protein